MTTIQKLSETTKLSISLEELENIVLYLPELLDGMINMESALYRLQMDLSGICSIYKRGRNEWVAISLQNDQDKHYLQQELQKSEFNSNDARRMLPTVVAQLDRDQIQRMNGQLCLDHLYQIQQGCVSEGDTGTECPPENDSAGDQYAIPHCAESSGTLHQTDTDSTQADGVFSASTSVSSVTHENVPFCTNCRQISTQFDEQIVHKTGWRPDIDILRLTPSRNDSASAEISQINNSKREKKFQPLLFSLFDTLNRMMMNEMEDCDELVQMNRKSGGELVGVLNAWHVRQQYLKTMKETLVKLDATACQNAEKSNMAFQDRDLMFGSSSALPVSFGNEPRFNASLSEIQEHIQTWKAGPDPSTTLSSPPLSIKCTMTEDVNSYLSHCTLDIREPNNFSTSRDSSGVFFGAPCGTGNVSVLNPRPTSMHHCASYMSLNIGCHRATNKL